MNLATGTTRFEAQVEVRRVSRGSVASDDDQQSAAFAQKLMLCAKLSHGGLGRGTTMSLIRSVGPSRYCVP